MPLPTPSTFWKKYRNQILLHSVYLLLLLFCATQSIQAAGDNAILRVELAKARADKTLAEAQAMYATHRKLKPLAEQELPKRAPEPRFAGPIPLHAKDVKITFYYPTDGSTTGTTAIMKRANPGKTVAVSRSLAAKGWLGRKVYIPGIGVRIVEDLMHPRIKGDALDVCVPAGTKLPPNKVTHITTIDTWQN